MLHSLYMIIIAGAAYFSTFMSIEFNSIAPYGVSFLLF